jgi:hypothetical protein
MDRRKFWNLTQEVDNSSYLWKKKKLLSVYHFIPFLLLNFFEMGIYNFIINVLKATYMF